MPSRIESSSSSFVTPTKPGKLAAKQQAIARIPNGALAYGIAAYFAEKKGKSLRISSSVG